MAFESLERREVLASVWGVPLVAPTIDTAFDAAVNEVSGSLDPAFNNNGLVRTNFSGTDEAGAVAIQPDGKIIVAGNGGDDFGLARYHANGKLDLSFGQSGKVRTNFGGVDRARGLALQPDGKIIVVGGVNNEADFGLARYHANGSLDTSFGQGGKVVTNFSGTDWAAAVALQPDGKIVVAGNGGADFGLARYHANGSLDISFGQGGQVRTNFAGVDHARGLALQPDGKIIVVGGVNNEADFGLARYHANGRLDTSFGQGGKVVTNFSGTDWAAAIALQRDGKIVVAGNGGADFGLARYHANGSLDMSFGQGGQVRTNFAGVDRARGLVLQPDGKIIVVGGVNNEADFGLARYHANGSLDSSFGQGGKVITNFSGTDWAAAVALQRDGKIVVAGNGGADFGIARYLNDPTPSGRAPVAPTALTVQAATSTSITLTWKDNANNENGFRVEWREAGRSWQATTIGANSTRHTVAGLKPGVNYEFRVRAFNDAQNSAYSGPVSGRTPTMGAPLQAPSQLTVQAATSTSITLTWKDNANNEKGFRVEWREAGKSWQTSTIGANSTRHAVTGLRSGTKYEFRVSAFNDAEESAYAGPIAGTTTVIPGLAARVTG